MSENLILWDRDATDSFVTLTLNRPSKMNAMDRRGLAEVPGAPWFAQIVSPCRLLRRKQFLAFSLRSLFRRPKDWAKDRTRRRKAGVPKEISFKTKPEIALEQLRWACESGLPRGVVLMDAGYGADTDVRANITTLGLSYVAGIMPNTTVWAPGTGPLPPKKWSGQGRPPKLIRRDARHGPNSVKALALALPANAWRTIKWREGSADWLSSRFVRLRVRVAHRDYNLTESRPEEWLLIE